MVNCTRAKSRLIDLDRTETSSVLARPGTPCSRRCPAGEQRDEQSLHHDVLADHDRSDPRPDRIDEGLGTLQIVGGQAGRGVEHRGPPGGRSEVGHRLRSDVVVSSYLAARAGRRECRSARSRPPAAQLNGIPGCSHGSHAARRVELQSRRALRTAAPPRILDPRRPSRTCITRWTVDHDRPRSSARRSA